MLLVDIGNSRIKGAYAHDDELRELPPVATTASPAFHKWKKKISDSDQLKRILVSNVAGAEVAGAFGKFAINHWHIEPEFVRPQRECHGMKTCYEDPEQLGVDRWLSALAAYHTIRGAVCVIDAGTALTVDIVNHKGEHLGGLIAPGPALMRESLSLRTAQLDVDSINAVSGFATNTRDAISYGCNAAVRGLFACVERDLVAAAPQTSFYWYLTGGAADLVRELFYVDYEYTPDLVLRGLALFGAIQ